jgi:Fe-S cluster assembly protein SufD
LFVSTAASGETARHPRTLVVAESQSEADVVEHYVHLGDDSAYFTNAACEYHLGPGAHLRHTKLVQEAPSAFHIATTRVRQQRDSVLSSHVFSLGGRIVRNEAVSTLDEENAEARYSGLYLVDDGQLIDNYLDVRHLAPHCTSYLGYKGVLDGKSNAVFTGRVYVKQHAQKTDSNQLNQNLLLSPKATVDTRPQLEIYADDVKCTHGATVGPPPPEQLFYFQTRGMSKAMAEAIMTYGFADEVVRKLPVEAVRETIEQHVFDKYSPL